MAKFGRGRLRLPALTKRRRGLLYALLILAATLTLTIRASSYLKEVSTEMALSDATDIMTLAVSDAVSEMMATGEYGYDYFVRLEKDGAGEVSAMVTNITGVNAFSSALLTRVVESADSGRLDIRVPLGNLLGMNVLLGKGPDIPVEIIMLTSSRAQFRNELESAGINQIKHRIILEVTVYIDVLIPWATVSDAVVSEVLIAETIIVGDVPNTYLEGLPGAS